MMIFAGLAGPTGNKWADLVIAAAAVVGALGVLWKKVLKPIVHGFAAAEKVVPVLLTIAAEFAPNGGSSLKDSLDRIEVRLTQGRDQIVELVSGQVVLAQGQATMKAELAGQTVKLDTLHDYAHDTNHQTKTTLEQMAVSYEGIVHQLDKLDTVVDEQLRVADALGVREHADDVVAEQLDAHRHVMEDEK